MAFVVLFIAALAIAFGVLVIYVASVYFGDEEFGRGDAVAVVDIVGEIWYDQGKINEIESYADDSDVKALLLFINSPGGGVAASQALNRAVNRVRVEKPVIACMASVAASGGYYIACAADSIVAEQGTITGSIGVIATFLRTEELYQKIGLDVTVIKAGKYKDVGSPFREMTKEERAYLSDLLDDTYSQFVQAVVEGRNLPEDDVRRIAEGRIYSGRQALDIGLVDRLGSYRDALLLAGEMAGIDGEPRVVKKRRRRPLIERLLGVELSGLTRNRHQRFSLQYIIP